jgi:GDPmannose 4,6-dehydratase
MLVTLLAAVTAKRALITGIAGQDGSYLAELLLDKGYEVVGVVRQAPNESFERLQQIRDRIDLRQADLLDQKSLERVLHETEPQEVYNLAGASFVAGSWVHPVLTAELTAVGAVRLLEAVRAVRPTAAIYQASSSEMFGDVDEVPQSERTPCRPRTPYGAAKVLAHFMTVNYRQTHGLRTCSGILFNHESPRRGLEYVSRRVTHGAAAIKLGLQEHLSLGNLESRRDWGFAPDYVEAMWLMMQREELDDFVIGTGVAHSVRDLVETAFGHVGLDYEEHVKLDPALLRPSDVQELIADPAKAKDELGWEAKTGFAEVVRVMVDADLARLRGGAPLSSG